MIEIVALFQQFGFHVVRQSAYDCRLEKYDEWVEIDYIDDMYGIDYCHEIIVEGKEIDKIIRDIKGYILC